MLLVADHLCVESLLVEVTDAFVSLVETLGVDAVEAVHAERNVVERPLDDEVKVVREEAVDVKPPAEAGRRSGQEPKPAPPVDVVDDDRHLRNAPNREVVSAGGRQNATGQASHAETVEPKRQRVGRGASVVTDMSRGQSPRHVLSGPRRFGLHRAPARFDQ